MQDGEISDERVPLGQSSVTADPTKLGRMKCNLANLLGFPLYVYEINGNGLTMLRFKVKP